MIGTSATRSVLRSLLRGYPVVLRIAAAMAAAAILIGGCLHLFGVSVEQSIWEYAGALSRWLLFLAGVLLTPAVLARYVAHGITRRTLTVACGLAMLLLVALTASYVTAGLLVEQAVFATAGRGYEFIASHPFRTPTEVHLVLSEYLLAGASYAVSGWLAGSAYYRFGGVRGTLLLPLVLLPAFAVENSLGTGQWIGVGPPTLGVMESGLPAAVGLPLAAAAIGLATLAQHTLTRTVPIRTRR